MKFYKIFLKDHNFSISTNLPPTAYLKMMDVWLLFSLFKPFVDIIVQTYIESLRDSPNGKSDEDEQRQAWVKDEIKLEKSLK